MTIVSPLNPNIESWFACQTVGRDADNILGKNQDWINIDKVQLMNGISEAMPKLMTRMRAQRSDGTPRWSKLSMLTNPGDMEFTAESNVLARGILVASQILKVAHHGSNGSSGGCFLAAVQPKEAVISVGPNSYGHPGADTLNRLSAAGAWIWRTDEQGTLVFTSYGITYTVPGGRMQVFLPVVMRQTGQTPLADVRISCIEYDPPGDDLAGEYVRIQNLGGTGATMTNWTLCDLTNNCYTFPSYALGAGATVKVWVKAGTNTQTDLYWGRGSAVWNNTGGDTAFLRDDAGVLVDQYSHP